MHIINEGSPVRIDGRQFLTWPAARLDGAQWPLTFAAIISAA